MKTYKSILTIGLALVFGGVQAQESTAFSLTEAEEYAVSHNEAVKNALLDIEIARKKVWETTAIGLLQVNMEGQYQQLLDIPVSVVDAQLFNPMAAPGEVLEFRMGQEFSSSLAINASQLIFDGSYIVGLEASKVFLTISQNIFEKTLLEVRKNIVSTYSSVLLVREYIKF